MEHQAFDQPLFLTSMGRTDEAIAEQRRAQKLDPIQPVLRGALGFILYSAGRHDETIEHCRAMTEFDPNFFTSWILLGNSSAEAGKFAEAEEALQKADALAVGTSTLILGIKGYVLALAGKRDEAREILDRMLELRKSRYVSAELVASLYSMLDEQDAAFEWLERAFEERDHWLCYAKSVPTLQRMRSDPRFQDILRRMRLDELP